MLLFGSYLLAGYYLAPGLIRSQASQWVGTKLHKSLAMGEIKVNPLGFTLDISDIAIPGPRQPMVAIGHLTVGFSPLSVFQDAYHLTELRIERPYVQAVIRPDGSLNIQELEPPPSPGEAPAIHIDTLDVSAGRVDFADESRVSHPQETLSPIDFTLKDFHTKLAEGGEFTFDARSRRNESFSWRGTLAMAPIASQGRFTIANLQLDTIGKILGDRLAVALTAGSMGIDGRYGFAYGQDGLKLNVTVAKLALENLALDGQDRLFHGGANIHEITGNGSFNLIGTGPVAATVPQVALKGLTLTGSGPVKGEAIRLAEAALSDAKLDFARRGVTLGALSLGGLKMDITREKDGAISVNRWLPAPPPAGTPAAAAPAPWNMQLGSFTLTNTAVHFEDRSVEPAARFDVKSIAVTATGLGSDLSKPIAVQVSAGINDKGLFKAGGTVTPGSRAADLKLSLASLPISPAGGYLGYPALDVRSGDLGVSGAVQLSGGDHSTLRFAGEASLDNLGVFVRADKNPLMAWRSLRLGGIHYAPGRIDIARARLSRPVGAVAVLADRSFNFTTLLAPKVAMPATPPAGTRPAMAFTLKSLDIDGGSLGFADYSIDPNFQARIDALQGSIQNIASAPDAVASIDLTGQVIDRFSPVTITGTANLLGYDRNTDIQMAFRDIELPIFNPYSGRYAGYAIAKGKLTTELHYKIVNRALQADHHVIIDQLEWGQASDSKDKVPWPVELATSLLKDRNGVIDLSLPVRGSLDDPSFRIWPVIWQIVGNIMEKIVTAPFSLIGSLFAGAEKAQYIDFAPGSAALPPGAADGLAALAKGLGDRPGLQLDIPAAPAPSEDAVSIADSRIDSALMANEIKKGQPADPAKLDAGELHDRLADLYRAKFGKRPSFPDVLPAAAVDATPATGQPPPDAKQLRLTQENTAMRDELRNAFLPSNAELAALGSARAAAVRDALATGGTDAARLFLVTNAAGTAMDGHVRLELKLR